MDHESDFLKCQQNCLINDAFDSFKFKAKIKLNSAQSMQHFCYKYFYGCKQSVFVDSPMFCSIAF